jgi:sn-glycerol 3-phosphate transport system substrate-binding protein
VLAEVRDAGIECPMTTAWQSWIHLENLSAYHDTPFATQDNGFAGLDTELAFNGPIQVQHVQTLGDWAQDGRFIYAGRRNEGGANFRAGECALFTESSAGYAGISAEASSTSRCARCPIGKVLSTLRRTPSSVAPRCGLWKAMTDEEYEGVAAFLNFLSSTDVQAKWHQDTAICRSRWLPVKQHARRASMTKTPAPTSRSSR